MSTNLFDETQLQEFALRRVELINAVEVVIFNREEAKRILTACDVLFQVVRMLNTGATIEATEKGNVFVTAEGALSGITISGANVV